MKKPTSKYARKVARGGSDYWEKSRPVHDAQNRAREIRLAAEAQRSKRYA